MTNPTRMPTRQLAEQAMLIVSTNEETVGEDDTAVLRAAIKRLQFLQDTVNRYERQNRKLSRVDL